MKYQARWRVIGISAGLIAALAVQPHWYVLVIVGGTVGACAFVGREVAIRRSKGREVGRDLGGHVGPVCTWGSYRAAREMDRSA